MFYVITYESGEARYGNFSSYADALNYADSRPSGEYTIEEYDSEEDWEASL